MSSNWRISPCRSIAVLLLLSVKIVVSHDIFFPENNENILYEGSACLFNRNSTFGVCVDEVNCPQAAYELQLYKLPPTKCGLTRRHSIVCCLSQNVRQFIDGFPAMPSAPLQKRKSVEFCETISRRVHFFVQGEVAVVGEFPHMVALGWTANHGINWKCGGTLISHNFVLTAAHCTTQDTQPDMIRIGHEDLNVVNPRDFRILEIINHPGYRPPSYYNDIALVRFEGIYLSTVKPACLWQSHMINVDHIVAMGYGHTSFAGTPSDRLIKGNLTIYRNQVCDMGFGNMAPLEQGVKEQSQICAGDLVNHRDTCQGDSGGPLQTLRWTEEQVRVYHVIGVTSFGIGCGSSVPAIYTRVSHFIDWIEPIVWPDALN